MQWIKLEKTIMAYDLLVLEEAKNIFWPKPKVKKNKVKRKTR